MGVAPWPGWTEDEYVAHPHPAPAHLLLLHHGVLLPALLQQRQCRPGRGSARSGFGRVGWILSWKRPCRRQKRAFWKTRTFWKTKAFLWINASSVSFNFGYLLIFFNKYQGKTKINISTNK